ncbi:MAG: hypothetical protein PVG03_06855, partial [Desulfarculaceae bacterium]
EGVVFRGQEKDTTPRASMLEVTGAVKDYARSVVKPRLGKLDKQDQLARLLEVVAILKDPKIGISSNKVSPRIFMNLARGSVQDTVPPGSRLLRDIPQDKREMVRILHNRYMLDHPAGIFFGPSASDIIQYRFAFGCTHFARAFIAIAKELHLVESPAHLRYAISSKHDDYNKCVQLKGLDCPTINGHQFALVRIKDRWAALNTNALNDYVFLPQGFDPDQDIKKKNIPVVFKSLPGLVFLLRKIGKDFNDDCGDDSLLALMNISRSGDPASSALGWGAYKP